MAQFLFAGPYKPTSLKKSHYLKLSLFATGFSGIVAEYLLATMASIFLGDSIVQWTMVLSTMLFAMGLGSRISKTFKNHLLEKFIVIELVLSVLVGLSALLVFSISVVNYEGVAIYGFSLLIGLLIGIEIPLVTRINESYEDLRVNISSVMENDYYGSLLGGVFFAFIAIPNLGITYTPYVLAAVNFGVAFLLFFMLRKNVAPNWKRRLQFLQAATLVVLATGSVVAQPIELYGEQAKYLDKVIYQKQTKYQRIVITQWKNDHWLYLNGNQQLSTVDEYLYHEPMVHAAVIAQGMPQKVLILGGGDGCAARELLKYDAIEKIDLVDLDPAMTDLGMNDPIFVELNRGSMTHEKVNVYNRDGLHYLETTTNYYDLILIDLPDPKGVELAQLYSKEMYALCRQHLTAHGVLITQAGSPYFATKAFHCIEKTMSSAGFHVIPLHNQVVTMGQWGWIMGHKSLNNAQLKQRLKNATPGVETRWLNHEALEHITSFGKPLADTTKIEINTLHRPVLYQYYLDGNWALY